MESINPRTPATTNRYSNLDALRLFLAMCVMMGHATAWLGWRWNYNLAVPAFLGLSGFLVLQSRENSRSLGHFFWKRFLRIYPLLIPVAILGWFVHPMPMHTYLTYIFTAGIQGGDGGAIGTVWTIGVEECLYFFLAVLWGVGAYRNRRLIVALFIAYTAYLAFGRLNMMPDTLGRVLRLPEFFFVGNLIYLYRDECANGMKAFRWAFFLLGVMCIFVTYTPPAYLLVKSPQLFAGPELGPMILIIGCLSVGLYARSSFSFLKKVGDLSYSIYLIHMPVMTWFLQKHFDPDSMVRLVAVATILLSLLSWHLIEKRALSLRNWRWRKQTPLAEAISPAELPAEGLNTVLHS